MYKGIKLKDVRCIVMIIDAFVREKMVNTTHEWIAYKAMEKLPNNWKEPILKER